MLIAVIGSVIATGIAIFRKINADSSVGFTFYSREFCHYGHALTNDDDSNWHHPNNLSYSVLGVFLGEILKIKIFN